MELPEELKRCDGVRLKRDRTRLLLAFKEPQQQVGVEALVAKACLELEQSTTSEKVNHRARLWWVHSEDGQDIPYVSLKDVPQPLQSNLKWIGPVYRSPKASPQGRQGRFCPVPSVLLIKPTSRFVDKVLQLLGPYGSARAKRGRKERLFGKLRQSRIDFAEVPPASERGGSDYCLIALAQSNAKTAYDLKQKLGTDKDFVEDMRFVNIYLLAGSAGGPNDTYYERQWNMTQINAEGGWEQLDPKTLSDVTVCILDNGCDLSHKDLAGRFYSPHTLNDPLESPITTTMGQAPPDNSHGTWCAGIVAGEYDSDYGIAGLAGNCRLMPVAFHPESGETVAESAREGIIYAADHGAHVINLSIVNKSWEEMPEDKASIDEAIEYAVALGCVLCVASGNDDSGELSYPSSHKEVIACGATDESGRRGAWNGGGSNYGEGANGKKLDVVAPGVAVLTTANVGEGMLEDRAWSFVNGTSMAAPHVAGLAALLLRKRPGLAGMRITNRLIRRIIVRTADKLPSYDYNANGWNPEVGYGRINVGNALHLVQNPFVVFAMVVWLYFELFLEFILEMLSNMFKIW